MSEEGKSPAPVAAGAPTPPAFVTVLSVVLVLFTLAEVNYPFLRPQSQLAIFAFFGLSLCFLRSERVGPGWSVWLGRLLTLISALVCGFVVIQTEPAFGHWWIGGSSLGDRAGAESTLDLVVGGVGLLLVLEATRRTVGWALPCLAGVFVLYGLFGRSLPDFLFPHRGYSLERIVSQTFLHSQGVFGTALKVMFTYVFLFVVFGAVLEATGATQFVIQGARRLFRGTVGGAAKVSVLSSGLMGSLSGSAVANTATTGTFTIPLMRSSGFARHIAAGVEAAASSGGALVPPVMGAGAYMMLEIVDPPVTYVEIIRAAIIPALLYYFSLFLIVHLTAMRVAGDRADGEATEAQAGDAGRDDGPMKPVAGVLFASALGILIVLLLTGYSPFRSVTVALGVVLVASCLSAQTRLDLRSLLAALRKSAAGSVALISAASCVGIVIGVVTLTGVGTRLPAMILPLADQSLLLALVLIMVSSIVLGMGLPSAVCYLLMATLIGPVLGDLGVVPLAAHLFIFYFGMMSMVTPPVALAAYTAASIAGSKIMQTGLAAFRFALVGFTLPYMFVLRPELLLLSDSGGPAEGFRVLTSVVLALAGIVPLAAAISGYLRAPIGAPARVLLGVAAALLLWPSAGVVGTIGWSHIAGLAVFLVVAVTLARPTGR